ncbi:hypothetical protein VIBNISFn118_140032 [Vibrio nigripulchritudo SFn118]|nr:hypothetical protein VIBNISFn118_140032 [Vibrio nigripulchritudo SFn118]
MKAFATRLFITIVSTFSISFFWMRYPYFFPRLSEENAINLVNAFGANNSEDISNLELYLVLSLSFLVSIFLLSVHNLIRRLFS